MSSNPTDLELQPTDDADVGTAVDDDLRAKILRHQNLSDRQYEAITRQLLKAAQESLTGKRDDDLSTEEYLEAVHWVLWRDGNKDDVLDSDSNPFPDADNPDAIKHDLLDQHRWRARGEHPPDAQSEYKALIHLAKALGYVTAATDFTRNSWIRFSKIEPNPESPPGEGKNSVAGDTPPIGRVRIGHKEAIETSDREPVIEHKSCEHIIVVALPRQGKDATIVSIGIDLMENHQYKVLSVHDDGRRETDMWAIPSDDPGIHDSLGEFGEDPRAIPTNVYVPAMTGLDEELPGNFEPFTVGLGDLTAKLILQLAGIKTGDTNTIDRIQRALEEARQADGDQVEVLVSRLQKFAEELEAEVTVVDEETATVTQHAPRDDMTEDDLEDDEEVASYHDGEDGAKNVRQITFEMEKDDILQECAQRMMMLAAEGLLEETGADTNLDMEAIIRDNDTVAVLNCDYLGERNKPLKYVITDLWLNLILKYRREIPSLPRCALEIRELKNICPSRDSNAEFPTVVKPLKQTIYEIATQGGSARVILLGSTQKLNDVYKAVRDNMPIKVMLKLDPGLLKTMDDSLDLPYRLRKYLEECQPGQGALKLDADFFWPCFFRGPHCGLGDGDRYWRDRYGIAAGFRVREHADDNWLGTFRAERCWVDHYGDVHETESPPDPHDWYLVASDLDEHTDLDTDELSSVDEWAGAVDRDLVESVAVDRREYPNPNDLFLRDVDVTKKDRSIVLRGIEEAKEQRMADLMNQGRVAQPDSETEEEEEFQLPAALRDWLEFSASKKAKLLNCLTEIEENEITSRKTLADYTGIPNGTLAPYLSDRNVLGACFEKKDNVYQLTQIGETALNLPWDELESLS